MPEPSITGAPPVPELAVVPAPDRRELVGRLAARLPELVPGLRVVAREILGAGDARIDLVAAEPSGRALLLLVGEAGDDLALVGPWLAQRAWLEARLDDWLQLAPELGLRPEAGVGGMLLCPDFAPETLAAVGALGDAGPALVGYRCVRNGGAVDPVLEVVLGDRSRPSGPRATPEPSPFRSGLSEAELGISPDERAEFE